MQMTWTVIPTGIYALTIDENLTYVATTTSTWSMTYYGPWLPYRNNFSLLPYGAIVDIGENINALIWLLIIFLVPMVMAHFIPRYGFWGGMIMMVLVISAIDTSFIPFMGVALAAISVAIYRRG